MVSINAFQALESGSIPDGRILLPVAPNYIFVCQPLDFYSNKGLQEIVVVLPTCLSVLCQTFSSGTIPMHILVKVLNILSSS